MAFKVAFTTALALVLLLVARGSLAQTGLPDEALGKEWGLLTLQLAPGKTTDTEGKGITIAFAADGTVSGSDGCNLFRGTYKADADGNLTILRGPSTMKACEEPIMEQARAFRDALDDIVGYQLVEGGLELEGPKGSALVFAELPVTGPPTSVPNTSGEELPLTALTLLALLMIGGGTLTLQRSQIEPA